MAPKITNQQQFVMAVKDYTRLFQTRADLQRQARDVNKQLKESEPEILAYMRQEEIPGVEVGPVAIRVSQTKRKPGITEKMIRECDFFSNHPGLNLDHFLNSLPREVTVKDKMSVRMKKTPQQQQNRPLQLENN